MLRYRGRHGHDGAESDARQEAARHHRHPGPAGRPPGKHQGLHAEVAQMLGGYNQEAARSQGIVQLLGLLCVRQSVELTGADVRKTLTNFERAPSLMTCPPAPV